MPIFLSHLAFYKRQPEHLCQDWIWSGIKLEFQWKENECLVAPRSPEHPQVTAMLRTPAWNYVYEHSFCVPLDRPTSLPPGRGILTQQLNLNLDNLTLHPKQSAMLWLLLQPTLASSNWLKAWNKFLLDGWLDLEVWSYLEENNHTQKAW